MKKKLMTALALVLVIAMSVAGTYAYLTSTDSVTNTFTVGQVKIKLDEAKANADGTLVEGAARVKANSYKLLPGHTYVKDPTVHVADNSEDCYLFVKVDNQITSIENTNSSVASQMAKKGWVAVSGQTGVYVYVGTTEGAPAPLAVSAEDDITVFEKIIIADTVDNATLASYANKTIEVTAYAVQADGFANKPADQIWTAAGFNTTNA